MSIVIEGALICTIPSGQSVDLNFDYDFSIFYIFVFFLKINKWFFYYDGFFIRLTLLGHLCVCTTRKGPLINLGFFFFLRKPKTPRQSKDDQWLPMQFLKHPQQ